LSKVLILRRIVLVMCHLGDVVICMNTFDLCHSAVASEQM